MSRGKLSTVLRFCETTMKRIAIARIVTALFALALVAPALAQEVHTIAEQPDQAMLEQWNAAGVTTVINMRPDEEMRGVAYDEKAAVEALGMRYVTVPFDRTQASPAITEALGAALDGADGKVALHCASGSRAANALAALQIERGEAQPETVQSAAPEIGLLPSMLRELSARYAAWAERR